MSCNQGTIPKLEKRCDMSFKIENNNSKYDRLSYIYERLSRSPDGVTIKEFSEELDVSTKTIQRDLHEALQDSGVYCEGRRWKLNKSGAQDGLKNDDRIVLGILDSLAKQAGISFYHKAHQLLEQISCQLDHPLFMSLSTETLGEENLKMFSILEDAIKARYTVQGFYTAVSKKKRSIQLKPLRLAFFDGYWYLLALDIEDNDTFKKFHLKSLNAITVNHDTFEYPKEIAETIEKAFSVWFTLEKPFEVRLWVDKEIAPYIERKPFHSQSIEGRDLDGSIEVIVKITHEMEIIPIVLWYIPYIRILEPQWLNDVLMEKINTYTKFNNC